MEYAQEILTAMAWGFGLIWGAGIGAFSFIFAIFVISPGSRRAFLKKRRGF